MEFHAKVRLWRERRGLSQAQLCEELERHGAKITQARVSHMETRPSLPQRMVLVALSRVLQVPLEFLCDDGLDDFGPYGGGGWGDYAYRRCMDLLFILGPDEAFARLAVAGNVFARARAALGEEGVPEVREAELISIQAGAPRREKGEKPAAAPKERSNGKAPKGRDGCVAGPPKTKNPRTDR